MTADVQELKARPRKKKVDDSELARLNAQAGLSTRDIAAITGLSKSTIANRLQRIENKAIVAQYKEARADVFAEKQVELLHSLDADKIKGMSGLQAITGLGILYDKERLERGQSTENVDIRTLSVSMDAKIDELKGLLSR